MRGRGSIAIFLSGLAVLAGGCSGADEGGPGQSSDAVSEATPMTCEEASYAFSGIVSEVAAANAACTDVADCAEYWTRLDCPETKVHLGECPRAVRADALDTVEAEVQRQAAAEVCGHTEVGCNAGVTCTDDVVVCEDGTCVLKPPTSAGHAPPCAPGGYEYVDERCGLLPDGADCSPVGDGLCYLRCESDAECGPETRCVRLGLFAGGDWSCNETVRVCADRPDADCP